MIFSTSSWLGTDLSLLPQPTFSGSLNGSDDWVFSFAKDTRLDCAIYANGSDFGSSAQCSDISVGYGVTVSDLVNWNPSLNTSCTLNGTLTYCVQQLRINATRFTEYCELDDTPGYGTTCDEFIAAWGIDIEQFAAFNPGIGSDCENWKSGRFKDLAMIR